jgi:hypothetical protein
MKKWRAGVADPAAIVVARVADPGSDVAGDGLGKTGVGDPGHNKAPQDERPGYQSDPGFKANATTATDTKRPTCN